jgi:aminoglycoside 2'-N-acetyltransferase I
VRALATGDLGPEHEREIRALLDSAFGNEFADTDWENARGGRHVVVYDGDELVAHAAVVPRVLEIAGRTFRTGYGEAVAARPDRQQEGFATIAMAEINAIVRREYEIGALSTARHGFYTRLGWERWEGPTFVRDGERLLRTEDDDDGLMVLRFGASASVELTAPITCEPRPGDDW